MRGERDERDERDDERDEGKEGYHISSVRTGLVYIFHKSLQNNSLESSQC